MNTLYIHLPVAPHLFSLFYSLAFLISMILLIYEGYKRKFPILPWILIISFFEILFILGTKLFALSHDQWSFMINNLVVIPTSKKVLVGGIILGGLGLLIGKLFLKFKPNFLDAFAIALPLVLSIQRLGCFFEGCCYGRPSELPWAVQYPVNTLPHFHHFQQAIIGHGDIFSLPVHPSQLYEFFGGLVVVIMVFLVQKKWKSQGSSFLFSFSLFLLVRFIIEFFRDPIAHTGGVTMFGYLNQIQLEIILLIPLLLLLLASREIRHKSFIANDLALSTPLPSILVFLSFSTFLLWVFSGIFQKIEIIAVLCAFFFAVVMTVFHIFKNYKLSRYRLLYFCLLIVPFFLMSQTLPETVNDSVQVRKSKSIGIGFASGDYQNSNNLHTGDGCDDISNTTYFNQKYTLVGGALNFKNENLKDKSETNFGVNVFVGKHNEINLTNLQGKKETIMGINPYFKYDIRWWGIGGGLHFGNLSYSLENPRKTGTGIPMNGREMTNIYPQIYFRVGPPDWLFIDYHLADHFPSALPGFRHQIGIGTGFGLNNGTNFRLGTSILGFYTSANLPLKNGLIIEPLLHWSQAIDNSNDFQFSLGLRYEFGQKIISIPVLKTD